MVPEDVITAYAKAPNIDEIQKVVNNITIEGYSAAQVLNQVKQPKIRLRKHSHTPMYASSNL